MREKRRKEKGVRGRRTHPSAERLLDDRRVPLRDEHEHGEDDGPKREEREERLAVGEVGERAALRLPRGAEAEGDDADGAPDEQGRDAGEIDEPSEDDAFAPDRREESDERHSEGEPRRSSRVSW